jgi:hypothetical protein
MFMFTVKDFTDMMTELKERAMYQASESKEVEDLLEELAITYELAIELFWLSDKEGLHDIKWHYLDCYNVMENEYQDCLKHERELARILDMFMD